MNNFPETKQTVLFAQQCTPNQEVVLLEDYSALSAAHSKLANKAGQMELALKLLTINRHTHLAGKEDIDKCGRCGKDVFHIIHHRVGESAKTDIEKAMKALEL